MSDKNIDFEHPVVYDGIQFEGTYPRQETKINGYTSRGHHNGPFVQKADYDNLLVAYKFLFEKTVAAAKASTPPEEVA